MELDNNSRLINHDVTTLCEVMSQNPVHINQGIKKQIRAEHIPNNVLYLDSEALVAHTADKDFNKLHS